MPDDTGWEVISRRPAGAPSGLTPPAATPTSPSPSSSPAQGGGDSGWQVLSTRPAGADPFLGNALLNRGRQMLQQQEQDIDYSTGASWDVRSQLQGASNPAEAQRVLERRYGRGNYGQDRFDQWWVKEGDKRISVLPKGPMGGLKNFLSGMAASPFATSGAAAGGVLGEIAFPAGGGIPGAMAGASLGKGLDQLQKWLMGTFQQKPTEVIGSMASEGAIAGALQGAGPAVRSMGAPIQRGLQKFYGVTPETSFMARDLAGGSPTSFKATSGPVTREGLQPRPTVEEPTRPKAVPPIGSYAPSATTLTAKRQLRDLLSGPGGSRAEKANVAYLNARMRGVLSNEGFPEPVVDKMMTEIQDTSARMSERAAGEAVTESASSSYQGLLRTAQESRDLAEGLLNSQTRLLDQTSRAPAYLGQSVADAIVTQRRKFSQAMGTVYKEVDRLAGDAAIISPTTISEQARQIAQLLPPQAVPSIIRDLVGRNESFTFEQAHALRTVFREQGAITDLAAQGVTPRQYRQMAEAVDGAISGAQGVAKGAVEGLKKADTLYREGIRRFENSSINRIVKELRSGIVPNPETVTRLFMKPDNINLAREVLKMVPTNVRGQVLQADLQDMLGSASTLNSSGRLVVDGQSFMKLLDDRYQLMQAVYPPDQLRELRLYAAQLAAFDGRIDATALRDGSQITGLLREAVAANQAAEVFATKNPLGALVSGSPMKVDAALRLLIKPGNEAVTEAAAHTLGEQSTAWKAVQRYALQKLFASSVVSRKSLDKTVAGESIDQALRGFTPTQQELLFPNGMADDLRALAKEARFLFPAPTETMHPHLAAGNIQQKMSPFTPQGWYAAAKYVSKQMAGWFADHPKLLRYLAEEVKDNPVRARSTMQVLRRYMFTQGLLSGAPKGPAPPAAEPEERGYGGTDL